MSNKKSNWLQQFDGIEVYMPHYNDGLFVFINSNINTKTKEQYKKLTKCPFYRDDEGKRIWKYRATKAGSKMRYQYDLVSIDLSVAEKIAEAVLKVAGKDVPVPQKSQEDKIIAKFLGR